jgi:hypothetical protein
MAHGKEGGETKFHLGARRHRYETESHRKEKDNGHDTHTPFHKNPLDLGFVGAFEEQF